MRYSKELSLALKAVRTASILCRKMQPSLAAAETIEKKDHSPVTVADFGSQAIINSLISSALPDDAIVGEEDANALRENSGLRERVVQLVNEELPGLSEAELLNAIDRGAQTSGGSRFWAVDPIDGTKGFLRGDQYAIALALIEKGEVVLGVLGCPNFSPDDSRTGGSLFYAVKGGGAMRQNLGGGGGYPVFVSPVESVADARFCESVESAHSAHDVHARICEALGISAPPCRIDSQVKYAAVASGRAEIYLRLPRSSRYREKIWDHAAGTIIVEEAGGKVTDFKGNPLDFSQGRTLSDTIGILATSGAFHETVLSSIRAHVCL